MHSAAIPTHPTPRALHHREGHSIVKGLAGVALAVLAGMLECSLCAAETAPPRPNIVFIIADDLGWGDVGFHGGNTPTPHLDQLAREGLELTQHYVAPVCSPTRCGLLTGRCWSRFGVTNPQNQRALPWDTLTLPLALRNVGYETCLTGKWHLGSRPSEGPNHFGFDHSYGSLAGGVSPWSHGYKAGPFRPTWHRNEELIEEEGHVTDLIADEAIRWLAARKTAPYFLYVPFTAVHLPLKEPKEWVQRVSAEITHEVSRHYAASIMHLDDAVGRILAAVNDRGDREHTLVVFTSDNGGSTVENNDTKYPDDQCPNGKLPGNNRPWRGQKGDLYEGGTRVPTLVSWPGKIPSGQVATPVQIIDWMPTFAALAGSTPAHDPHWDGVDLSALLLRREPLTERALYAVSPGWRARSVRRGDWKLIVHGEDPNRRVELFNLATDSAESRNLADTEPQQVEELTQLLNTLSASDRDSAVRD